MHIADETRDAKDPMAMEEQILAIAPILPGQRGHPKFDIPPRAGSLPTSNANDPQRNRNEFTPTSGGGDDLIDFGHSAPDAKAVATDNKIPPQQRARSISLMDDDQHVNAMNDKIGKMHMESTKPPATALPGEEKPLERSDTQTSEVDSFFDAEG